MVSQLAGKSVLITGATGSFGNAFVQRALDDGAKRVVCFSRDELKQSEMAKKFSDPRTRFFLGDVRDLQRITQAMRGCDIVVHAAAMKRIEQCEADPWEATLTNVIGTHNVAEAAIANGVSHAVFLSTDKAPAAHTLYGATKFCAERLWIQSNVLSAGGPTRFAAVRYGNVLGSRGSVLDVFKKQAESGTVTVTDPSMTRFWMQLADAVNLVCLAITKMRGGEVFVGRVPSAPLLTLVEAVAPDAKMAVTGLRSNERLHETLISSDEAPYTYQAPGFYVIEPATRTWGTVSALPYPKVPADFTYRSDTNPYQLSVSEMRQLVAA